MITCAKFSSDSTLLATGSKDKMIKVYDFKNYKILHRLSGHTKAISCLDISTNSALIVSGSLDQTVKLWDIAS